LKEVRVLMKNNSSCRRYARIREQWAAVMGTGPYCAHCSAVQIMKLAMYTCALCGFM
jgi:hypothetical protein